MLQLFDHPFSSYTQKVLIEKIGADRSSLSAYRARLLAHPIVAQWWMNPDLTGL